MVSLSNVYNGVEQSVDPQFEGNLIYYSLKPHRLKQGDKIRVQSVTGNDYSTNETTVLYADDNVMFITDQKGFFGTDSMGVFAKKEGLLQKIAMPALAVGFLYLLLRKK